MMSEAPVSHSAVSAVEVILWSKVMTLNIKYSLSIQHKTNILCPACFSKVKCWDPRIEIKVLFSEKHVTFCDGKRPGDGSADSWRVEMEKFQMNGK